MMFDANDTSFVPLLRKIKGSPIVRSWSQSQLWLWLLADAEYYPKTVKIPVRRSLIEIELQLGETFIQTDELSKYLFMTKATLRRALLSLRNNGSITLESTEGGYKVKLVKAEEYWNRRGFVGAGENELTPVTPMERNMERKGPLSSTTNTMAPRNGKGTDESHDGGNLNSHTSNRPDQDLISQGLPAPLRIIEPSSSDVVSVLSTSQKKKKRRVVHITEQLELMGDGIEDVGGRLEISEYFAKKTEEPWNALKSETKWICAILERCPDVQWVLSELAGYYLWWLKNPKKRRPNLAGSLGNCLNRDWKLKTFGTTKAGTKSFPVATEPGKYDGIGVTYSEFEE